jgi:TPR repeat protein
VGLDLAAFASLIGDMKIIPVLCLSITLVAPVGAQEIEPTDREEPAPVFPAELLLLPQDVQDAAEQEAAATPETHEGINAADEAFQRALRAYASEDWVSAQIYSETAAVGGNAQAATLAGLIARDGQVDAPDMAVAAQWFRRAADQDEAVALFNLGLLAAMGRDDLGLGASRSWYERAARGGHVDAMVSYASVLRASPIPQDAIGAREWAERAAQLGNFEGMYQFAQLLDEGVGGPEDKGGARFWYERAGEQQLAEAAMQAGMMWAAGEGGEQDDVTALEWLRIAAESGYAPAQGQYGLMLYQGRGTEIDLGMAAYWFGQGAEGNDAESQFLYAFVLARGEGVTTDFEAAYRWVLEGAFDVHGVPVHDETRDRLQAGLENALPVDVQQRVQMEVSAAR